MDSYNSVLKLNRLDYAQTINYGSLRVKRDGNRHIGIKMGEESSPLLHETVHNFGVFKKSGKRAIFQLDFPNKRLNFIQRGVIKESYQFQHLKIFDSEDGFLVTLKFEGKDLEFDADNMEEKYTICRLLSLVQENNFCDNPEAMDVRLVQPRNISTNGPNNLETIKDGFLDKRGNAKIPIWSRRRVRISPGEFSYYRSTEKNALNVVQIKSETCHITVDQADGFVVSVRDRNYFFRLPKESSKYGSDRQAERESWIKAFGKACETKRRTLIMLDKQLSGSQWSLNSLGDELDVPSPPASPAPSILTVNDYEIPEPDYSGSDQGSPEMNRKYRQPVPLPRELSRPTSPPPVPKRLVNGLKSPSLIGRPETENVSSSGPFSYDIPVKKVHTNTKDPVPLKPPRQTIHARPIPLARVVTQTVDISRNNEMDPPNRSTTPESLRNYTPFPPEAPPLPPPVAPPIPHTRNVDTHPVKRIMKAIHWSRVPHHLLSDSIWEHTKDFGSKLDLTMLEDEFANVDSGIELSAQVSKKSKELLLDPKRAQNLEISLSGLRMNGTIQLEEALNSLREDEALPVDKLSTLRRYQPTPDEVEMYKMYTDKREDLHPMDQFMLDLCEIPCFGIRLDLVLTIWEFPKQFDFVSKMVSNMDSGCDEMLSSREFVMILEYLLAIGNYMNTGTSTRADTVGFLITSLDKILDVRGRNKNYTLTHYLVQQLQQIEPELLEWPTTVANASKCGSYSIKAITAEIEVLQSDLTKIKKNLKILQKRMKHCKAEDKQFRKKAKEMALDFEMKLDRLSSKCGQLQKKYLQVLDKYGEQTERTSDEFFGSVSRFVSKFKSAKREIVSKG